MEYRAKISAGGRGRNHSEETKAKMSSAGIGHVVSTETRTKISAARKRKPSNFRGHKHSIESRIRMISLRQSNAFSLDTLPGAN